MKCREARRLAYLYREGEIPGQIRHQLLEHAASCERCFCELRQARSMGLQLADLRRTEPRLHAQRDLTEQVMRGIDATRAGDALPRSRPAGPPFRRLQFACTLAAAAIVTAFFFQNAIDVYRMLTLESRLSESPITLSTAVEEPRLAALGLNTMAHLGRALPSSPAAANYIGLRERQQLRDVVRSFFEVLEAGPPGFAGEVQRLRAKYPEIWLISPLDGLTSRDRLVLSRQGKSLLRDLRNVLQPGRSYYEK